MNHIKHKDKFVDEKHQGVRDLMEYKNDIVKMMYCF